MSYSKDRKAAMRITERILGLIEMMDTEMEPLPEGTCEMTERDIAQCIRWMRSVEMAGSGSAIAKQTPLQQATAATWAAYDEAYQRTYHCEPTRNLTVNSQVKQFVQRVGADHAPAIAAFYLNSRNSFYTSRCHPFGLLLRDAEALATQWKRQQHVLNSAAKESDDLAGKGQKYSNVAATLKGRLNGTVG